MMLRRKTVIFFCIGMLFAATVLAGALVSQVSSLSGTVASVVQVGASVKEGDILLKVNTVSGVSPATRASVDGVVGAVLVRQGDAVKAGQEVVRIQTH